jgi:hypothetical protein
MQTQQKQNALRLCAQLRALLQRERARARPAQHAARRSERARKQK